MKSFLLTGLLLLGITAPSQAFTELQLLEIQMDRLGVVMDIGECEEGQESGYDKEFRIITLCRDTSNWGTRNMSEEEMKEFKNYTTEAKWDHV